MPEVIVSEDPREEKRVVTEEVTTPVPQPTETTVKETTETTETTEK